MRKPRKGHLAALCVGLPSISLLAGCRPPVRETSFALPAPPPDYVPVANSANAYDAYALAAREVEQVDHAQLTQVSFYPGQRKTAVARCTSAVAEVERATRLPCDFKFVARPPFHPPLYQAGWRIIGHVMRWQIDADCAHESWDHAIATAISATKFGFDLTAGGPTDASLGFAIVDDVREGIAPYLPKMGAGQLGRLADGLTADLERRPSITQTIAHDAENVRIAIATLRATASAGDDRNRFDEFGHNLGPDVKEAVDYLESLHGNPAKLADYFRQFEAEGAAEAAYLTAAAERPAAERGDPPKPTAKERPWKHLARHFFRTCAPLLEIDDRTVAGTRLLVLAARIEQQVKMTKQLPPNLARFAGAISTDPFTGIPFRYRTDGAGYALYSVGPNLRDDGGQGDDLKLETGT